VIAWGRDRGRGSRSIGDSACTTGGAGDRIGLTLLPGATDEPRKDGESGGYRPAHTVLATPPQTGARGSARRP
jgi:hypothetical protein